MLEGLRHSPFIFFVDVEHELCYHEVKMFVKLLFWFSAENREEDDVAVGPAERNVVA